MTTRIPIQNLYYLLCYAWDKLPEGQTVEVGSLPGDRIADLCARVLVSGTRHLVRRGFDRGYRAYEAEATVIRGRVNFPATARRALLTHGRIACEFDELDYNVLHNRIVKTTLERLVSVGELAPMLKAEARDVLRQLRGVEPITISSQLFRRVQLHRNNRYYGFLLNVCELVHENLIPDERGKTSRFRDFWCDEQRMRALFEAFVRNFYRYEQRTFEVRALKIAWRGLRTADADNRYLPEMRTDVCLFNDRRKIILDCKYSADALQTHHGKETVRSSHLYQLFAYLKNKEADAGWEAAEGVLLYPTATQSLDVRFELDGHRINVRTLNLNQDWQGIKADLLALIAG